MADNAAPVFLLTRPRAQSERFATQMRSVLGAQADIRIHPLQEIVTLAVPLDLAGVGALAFTSENGVRAFAEQNPARDLPAFCVGDRTAAVADELGFAAHSASGGVGELADLISSRPPRPSPEGRILHLHGQHKAGDLVSALRRKGLDAESCAIYEQRILAPQPDLAAVLNGNRPIIAPVFSPRSAAIFSQAVAEGAVGSEEAGARVFAIAISQATRDALSPELAAACEVLARPSGEDMLLSLAKHNSP